MDDKFESIFGYIKKNCHTHGSLPTHMPSSLRSNLPKEESIEKKKTTRKKCNSEKIISHMCLYNAPGNREREMKSILNEKCHAGKID
jgi:hypothetical protein